MKYAVILGNVGSCSDRYMTGGYSEPFTVEQLFERLSTIDNVHAVEFVGGWQADAGQSADGEGTAGKI